MRKQAAAAILILLAATGHNAMADGSDEPLPTRIPTSDDPRDPIERTERDAIDLGTVICAFATARPNSKPSGRWSCSTTG